jgi:hypothetical protein
MSDPVDATDAYSSYNTAEKANYASAIAFAYLYFQQYVKGPLSNVDWVTAVARMFAYVFGYRDYSSELARTYYDVERSNFAGAHLIDVNRLRPDALSELIASGKLDPPKREVIERHPIFKADYEPGWLLNALEPVREDFQAAKTTPGAVTTAAGIVGKDVLNGGRRTIIQAVPDDQFAKGWARVQGGDESCAFCWMLISRGPVYSDSKSAGLNANGTMNQWHPNCDCRVVPVFDKKSWPGREEFLAAEKLWIATTKDVSGYTDTKRGTRNEKYYAFRKALGDGYANSPGDVRFPVPTAA